MLDKKSTAKLDAFIERKKKNIARLIYITYRHFNEWALAQWAKDGWGDMRPDHLRLISIIGKGEVNNNELARRARVSKQAMSKMVNVLMRHGFITVKPDPNDSRAKIISVSKEGVDFLEYLGSCNKNFEALFVDIIGEKKTQQLIDILGEVTEGILEREMQEFDHDKQRQNY